MTTVAESMPAIYKDSIIAVKTKSGEEIVRVKRINAKSLVVTDVSGNEGSWKTPYGFYQYVRKVTEAEADRFRAQETKNVAVFRIGNVVRWPSCTHPMGRGKLLVVTKVNADGACNLVPLGGVTTLQYFRSVPAVKLEKVDGDVSVVNA